MIRKGLFTLAFICVISSLQGVTEITDSATLKSHIDSGKPVVVKFYASWCGPCKALAPTFDKIANENSGKATFLKVEDEQGLAQKYKVTGYPTVIFYKDGTEISRLSGSRKKEVYERELEKISDGKITTTKMVTTMEEDEPATKTVQKRKTGKKVKSAKSCKTCKGCSSCK